MCIRDSVDTGGRRSGAHGVAHLAGSQKGWHTVSYNRARRGEPIISIISPAPALSGDGVLPDGT